MHSVLIHLNERDGSIFMLVWDTELSRLKTDTKWLKRINLNNSFIFKKKRKEISNLPVIFKFFSHLTLETDSSSFVFEEKRKNHISIRLSSLDMDKAVSLNYWTIALNRFLCYYHLSLGWAVLQLKWRCKCARAWLTLPHTMPELRVSLGTENIAAMGGE